MTPSPKPNRSSDTPTVSPLRKRLPQIALTALFVAQLATVVALNRRSQALHKTSGPVAGMTGVAPVPAAPDALARHGFVLEEVAQKAGISFVHQGPRLDPKLAPILPRIADMGAGVAVADFDRDGWPDLYVTDSAEGGKNRLYHNNHDGTFTDVAEQAGVTGDNNETDGTSMGAVWGDFDNDGYEDLLVYKWGRTRLYHNEGGKRFVDVSDKANLPAHMNCNNAIWLDYDRDGKLDLLLNGYFDEKWDLWHLADTRIMPDSLEYATNGTRKHLMRNRGDGTFEDVTQQVGLDTRSWALAAGAVDLCGTGYPDLLIANDYGKPELWRNENGKRFVNTASEALVGMTPKSGMNVAFGDIRNDGQFSAYVTNVSEEGVLIQGNNLWVPRPGTNPPVYDNLARDMSVEIGGWSFGAQFADLNNDGFQDLYLTNGYISADPKNSYWYDYARVSAGNKGIIQDVQNWPAMKGRSLSGFQQKRVWMGDGAGRFTDVAQAVGASDRYDGRAVAVADLWNRGAVDVVVANQRGPLLVYKNTPDAQNNWVAFDLEGTKSNKSAIGAQVTLYFDGMKQVQAVMGGSGFCAQNDRRLHFGVGHATKVEKAVVRWPSGETQTINAPALKTLHKVKEPA